MDKYPSIKTVYKRDPDTKFKYLINDAFAKPEFGYLDTNLWIATEKVDGTNIRVSWELSSVVYGGRTDRAQIPATLFAKLTEMFPLSLFQKEYHDTAMTLYGEGYGAKIQKGGDKYISDGQSFILFDIKIGDVWLKRNDIEDVAYVLGIKVVPIIGIYPLVDLINIASEGFQSQITNQPKIAEGLVMRPQFGLKDRLGNRIITKIKYKDFKHD